MNPPLIMQSINFEFLRPKWPELAGLGGFAEAYAHSDPLGAIGKLRSFCEQTAKFIHHELKLPRLFRPNLIDILEDNSFKSAVPSVIVSKLHTLRVEGNHAVHGNKGDTTTALRLTKEAFDLGRWLFVNFAQGAADACPQFTNPPEGGVEATERRKEKRAILERLAAQEAQLQKLLEDLETERSRAQQAEATKAELELALQAGQKAAASVTAVDPTSFNEAETRQYLIDLMLADAGWKVGTKLNSTAEVKKELKVSGQPTSSGYGYIDYVLLDDNDKPLAIIEAKKTSVSPEAGRKQAELYADGLAAETGQRPIIMYTNGVDLWLWNDAAGEPPRIIYGYYSKNSLQHLHFQRQNRKPVSEVTPNPQIAGRLYQIEAVRRVVEKFAEKKRKALIVQATGTGKTRVAISLCDALIRANWAKRILFLCDRRELRTQADKAFAEYLPAETRTIINSNTPSEVQKRIYLGTYPAMMKIFETFDVGFFDLIIADESHRSLYSRYKVIFDYFDCYQVGLTATPINENTATSFLRNTFKMFQCDDLNPTFNYDYITAVERNYLVPFKVDTHTTQLLRDGIKNSQLTETQREQIEENGDDPSLYNYDAAEIDKKIFNKETNRHILRNLMEHGIRVADETRLGKTIVFARNHNHAVLLQNLFDEMYPQYGGQFCRVIDNYDPRAEELIKDLKGTGTNPQLTIAISVDMLDTGIDIPELVNLVFAKPVFSYVKFWQMIGRGTRLCPNLFGPGAHKTHFQIFDHWGNFERFEEGYEQVDQPRSRSITENVFLTRIELARTALQLQDSSTFELATKLIAADLKNLPEKTIPVREKFHVIQKLSRPETLQQFDPVTQATLQQDIAPLMDWVNIAGHLEAYRFDRLITRLQIELLRQSSKFQDYKDELLKLVTALRINLSQVKIKLPLIDKVKTAAYWEQITVAALEELRTELRGIIEFRESDRPPALPPKVIDIADDPALIERHQHQVKLDQLSTLDMVAYRNRVERVLLDIIDDNETLQKIKAGQPVQSADLEALCSLVLTQDSGLNLHDLLDYYPESAGQLDIAIRSIIGLDAQAVQKRFTHFVQAHPTLASHQIKFLDLLQNHIAKYGSIELDRLYEPPFTLVHSDSLDGLFDDPLADELIDIIDTFKPNRSKE
jgi:type I restriction enzyme, R subunit